MVVLDESQENFSKSSESIIKKDKFIVEVPVLEKDPESLREERRRNGRYLAVSVILFLVLLGLYHAISYGSQKMTGLLGATLTMFLYLLWLLYAAQRRKKLLKESEKHVESQVEKQVTNVLQSINNLKMTCALNGAHDNLMYSSSSDEDIDLTINEAKKDGNNVEMLGCGDKTNLKIMNSRKISESAIEKQYDHFSNPNYIFVRTYSVA